MKRRQTRFTITWAKRVFCGAVMSAASRSRVSVGDWSSGLSASASALPVTAANGQTGATGSPGFNVALMSGSRTFFSKNAAGTMLVLGTVTVLRSNIAASA